MKAVSYPCHRLAEPACPNRLARIRIDSRNELSSCVLIKNTTSIHGCLCHYTRRPKHPVMQSGAPNVNRSLNSATRDRRGGGEGKQILLGRNIFPTLVQGNESITTNGTLARSALIYSCSAMIKRSCHLAGNVDGAVTGDNAISGSSVLYEARRVNVLIIMYDIIVYIYIDLLPFNTSRKLDVE